MTPQKAYNLGVRPDDITIRSDSRSHGGRWVIRAEDVVLTEMASLFGACAWRAELLREAVAACPC